MSKINPNDPARPVKGLNWDKDHDYYSEHFGLTIRQELAARFMASTIDSDIARGQLDGRRANIALCAEYAIMAAEILIQKLNETER